MSKPFDHTADSVDAKFKATNTNAGQFAALVSVFGNVDHGGERVIPGAFSKSLGRWREKGDPIPVIWNHMWEDPRCHIGKVDPEDAEETDDGLMVKGSLDLDNPFAKQVYRLLAERRVKEFSFGYNLLDSERRDGALDLLEIDLFEVGPTLKGMNPETELLAVKALAVATSDEPIALEKDGRLHSPEPLTPMAKVQPFPPVNVKAGARHSKETMAALNRIRDQIDQLIAAGQPADETPKSTIEAETSGKASDPDEDVRIQIQLFKEAL